MRPSLGKVSAVLAESTETIITNDLIKLINSNVNPPEVIGPDDVYIRAMYIVSEEINSFGGRFPKEEQEQLTKLMVDSPVMVGHRKDKLPIGRTFHATITERKGSRWVKSYFYWLKSADGAETLRENVDGGIYKECSIGFTFLLPECSICNKDIRLCEHEPLVSYVVNKEETSCYYNYRQIERVLETSLVYRGAVTDTAITNELRAVGTDQNNDRYRICEPLQLEHLDQLDYAEEYIVAPMYASLPVKVSTQNGKLVIHRIDNSMLSESIVSRFASLDLGENQEIFGCLIGLRGRERCSARDIINFIEGGNSPVNRLELHLLNRNNGTKVEPTEQPGRFRIRSLRHRIVSKDNLPDAVRRMQTRDGVRIWLHDSLPPGDSGYHYRSSLAESLRDGQYGLLTSNEQTFAVLLIRTKNKLKRYRICQFNYARLSKGMRFLADEINHDPSNKLGESYSGRVISSFSEDGGMKLTLQGKLSGRFIIRPVKLDGEQRYLYYRVGS